MSTPEARAAYDAARATEMRRHQYKTNNEQLRSTCMCGVVAPTADIGVHIQQQSDAAGQAAIAT